MTSPFYVPVRGAAFIEAVRAGKREGQVNCIGANCVVQASAYHLMLSWHTIDPLFTANPRSMPRFELTVLPDGSPRHALLYTYDGMRYCHILTEQEHNQVRPWTELYDLTRTNKLGKRAALAAMKELHDLDLVFYVDPATDEQVRSSRIGEGKPGKNSEGDKASSRRYSAKQRATATLRSRQAQELHDRLARV